MFRKAIYAAAGFTRPVVISRLAGNQGCDSSVAAFVVVNKDGWALTADHVIGQLINLNSEINRRKETELLRENLKKSSSMPKGQKKRELKRLDKSLESLSIQSSVWWAYDDWQVAECKRLPPVDLALIKFEPFDAKQIAQYPKFKNPENAKESGASLCKLGYPFNSLESKWDKENARFILDDPNKTLPIFPMDGISTRVAEIIVADADPLGFPLFMLETSSPGLRGQSGGPTFDSDAAVWAIQAQTRHLPLGFSPPVPGKPNQLEHQFLNVGLGAHVETVLSFMDAHGVSYEVTDA